MIKRIMDILNAHPLNEFKLLGYIDVDGLDYLLVTSIEDEMEVLTVFEIDGEDVDEYSLAITEGNTALRVFKEWCRREIQKSDAGYNDATLMNLTGGVY